MPGLGVASFFNDSFNDPFLFDLKPTGPPLLRPGQIGARRGCRLAVNQGMIIWPVDNHWDTGS